MKKLQLKFAAQKLTREEMRHVAGGGPIYSYAHCYCGGEYVGDAPTGVPFPACINSS